MLMKGDDVRTLGAVVSMVSWEELDRGLEVARVAGELGAVSDVVGVLGMPVLAEFLKMRGARLQSLAADQVLRFTSTRALAEAINTAGADLEAMGEQEAAEGMVRIAVSNAAAERSAELSVESELLAEKGADELITAEEAREVAKGSAKAGLSDIVEGAEMVGEGETLEAGGEVLEEGARVN